MRVFQEQKKQYYLIYVKQYAYCISEYPTLFGYSKPIEIDKYYTIVESIDEKAFKDIIYKGRKYKKDFSTCFSGFREMTYIRPLDDFDSNLTKQETLTYLRDYIAEHKNEITSEIQNNKNKVLVKKGEK